MKTITIIGAGMMGSALAFPARENGHEVRLVGTHLDREIIRYHWEQDHSHVDLRFFRDLEEIKQLILGNPNEKYMIFVDSRDSGRALADALGKNRATYLDAESKGTKAMTKLLKVPELQNPLTGLNFQGTGILAAPLGAQLHRTSAVEDGTIIGIDSRYALELVRAGEVLVEYDKLIDRQLERAAITSISGFGKICTEAAAVLKV